MLTIEQSIGKWLAELGITHIYGIGAVPMHDTFRHCAKAGLNLIGTHEQRAAVLMAASHNYFAGKQIACAIVSMGPSVTNSITGAFAVLGNQWPVMIISNSPAQDQYFPGMFQAYDAIPAMESVTRHAVRIADTQSCYKCLAEAYNAANRTPRGPAYIDIPTPLLTQPVHSPAKPANNFYSDESVHNDCAAAVEALTSARRPLLLLGQNIRWNNDYKLIQKLIDTYDIPFATVSMARGFISENHPLCVTRNATLAQAESDVVIVIGGALDWKYRFGVAINPDAAIFQLSEDPSSPSLDRKTTTIDLSAAALLSALNHGLLSNYTPERDLVWMQSLNAGHKLALKQILDRHAHLSGPISSYAIAIAAARVARPDTLFILDANTTMRAADLCLEPKIPLTHITAGHTGLMGGGIPFGIAALTENNKRPVIVICGDFALGQNALELETAARLNLPLIVLLANNNAGTEGIYEFPGYTSAFTKFSENIAYEWISRAFGGLGDVIDKAEDLPAAINAAIKNAESSSKPFLLNIHITERLGMPPRL